MSTALLSSVSMSDKIAVETFFANMSIKTQLKIYSTNPSLNNTLCMFATYIPAQKMIFLRKDGRTIKLNLNNLESNEHGITSLELANLPSESAAPSAPPTAAAEPPPPPSSESAAPSAPPTAAAEPPPPPPSEAAAPPVPPSEEPAKDIAAASSSKDDKEVEADVAPAKDDKQVEEDVAPAKEVKAAPKGEGVSAKDDKEVEADVAPAKEAKAAPEGEGVSDKADDKEVAETAPAKADKDAVATTSEPAKADDKDESAELVEPAKEDDKEVISSEPSAVPVILESQSVGKQEPIIKSVVFNLDITLTENYDSWLKPGELSVPYSEVINKYKEIHTKEFLSNMSETKYVVNNTDLKYNVDDDVYELSYNVSSYPGVTQNDIKTVEDLLSDPDDSGNSPIKHNMKEYHFRGKIIKYSYEIDSGIEKTQPSDDSIVISMPVEEDYPPLPPPASPVHQDEDFAVEILGIEDEFDEGFVYKEISEWDKIYQNDVLVDDLVNELTDFYDASRKRKSIDEVTREAISMVDLINEYKKSSTDMSDKSTKSFDLDYKPFLSKILKLDFTDSYICPIVHDQKKFYTTNGSLLGDTSIDDEDIFYLSHEQELKILNELQTKYRKKDETGEEYTNHKVFANKLYDGGSITVPIQKSSNSEEVFFRGIYPTHYNEAPTEKSKLTYYKGELAKNALIYRNCYNTERGCTGDPETGISVEQSRRMANGPYTMLEDVYDERLVSESTGKIKSCTSIGDRYYSSKDSESDLNKTISRSPYYNKYISGENINIVGFYIRALDDVIPPILNGPEDIILNGDIKSYSEMFNSGYTLADVSKQAKQAKSAKQVIINNYEEFDWQNYKTDTNYVIMFNNKEHNKLDANDYEDILEHIIPSVDDIMKIEYNKIKQCENTLDIAKILNKHGLYIHQLNTNVFLKYNIPHNIIINISKLNSYEQYMNVNHRENKINLNKFIELHESILNLKYKVETDIQDTKYSIPSDKYILTLKITLNEITEHIFDSCDINFLDKFIRDYLNIRLHTPHNELMEVSQLKEIIINHFILNTPILFSASQFNKYFLETTSLIHEDYRLLFNEFIEFYNIDINAFKLSKMDHFDKSTLKQLHLIRTMKKHSNNADELMGIIDLSNMKFLKNNIHNTIMNYAQKQYEFMHFQKQRDTQEWSELTYEEKMKYIPNQSTVKQLRDRQKHIYAIYNKHKEQVIEYLEQCNNLKIMKTYYSKELLLADNDIPSDKKIYIDPKYDTTTNDVNLYSNLSKEHEGGVLDEEFTKLMKLVYMFDTNTEVEIKILNAKNSYTNPSDRYRHIMTGDLCILHLDTTKLLYRRQGNLWIPVDDDTFKDIDKCYNYDKKILSLDFDEIEQYCLSNKSALSEENCIQTDDKPIIVKLYKIYTVYSFIKSNINNLTKVLLYKENIDTNMKTKEENIRHRLHVLHDMERRKQNTTIETAPSEEQTKIYPPKYIQTTLESILKTEDFDVMGTKLKEFIEEYGVEIKYSVSGELLPGKFWYYNLPDVNVPLVCKHYEQLLTSVLKDNTEKARVLDDVRDMYGKSDGEYYYCTNCGEIIDYCKYSTFEGFGKNDTVINIREVVIDIIDDDDEFTSIISSDKIATLVNILLKKANIDIRATDYELILKIIENRRDTIDSIDFNRFYYSIIMSKPGPMQTFVSKSSYTKAASKFEELGGKYELAFFKTLNESIIKQERGLSKFLNLFYKRNESKDGAFIKYFKGYKWCLHMSYAVAIVAEVIRTSIPDYNIVGSGKETNIRKGNIAGILISDTYQANVENDTGNIIFWIVSYFKDIIYEDIASNIGNQAQFIKGYLSKIYENPKLEFSRQVEEFYNEIKEMGDFKYRDEDKANMRLNQLVKQEPEDEIQYDWNEFLPALGFNSVYEYVSPDINAIIVSYNTLYSELEGLNKTEGSQSRLLEISIQLKEKEAELIGIAEKLTYSLMIKINTIITAEKLTDDFNVMAYTASSNYDKIYKHYIDVYGSKDATIKPIVTKLNRIQLFLKKHIHTHGTVYEISKNFDVVRDLQGFMKLDTELYNNDDTLIKKALIIKLKQIHYVYITEGPNAGNKRYFREVNDSDYSLLIDLYSSADVDEDGNLDIADIRQRLHDKLVSLYGADYPTIEYKLKLILDHNGKAEVDIITNEIKAEISDRIDQDTHNKSKEDIEKIIISIEQQFNQVILDTKTPYKLSIQEKTNSDLIESKLNDMLTNFSIACKSEDISAIIQQLLSIQQQVNNKRSTGIISKEDYVAFQSDITGVTKPYFELCDDNMNDRIDTIIDYIKIRNVDKSQIKDTLDNIANMDDYYSEFTNQITSNLKIEGIQNETLIKIEEQFRKNSLLNDKSSNKINIHISIIRYIINLLSYLHYQIPDAKEPSPVPKHTDNKFLIFDDREIMDDIENGYDNIVRTVIGQIEEQRMSRSTLNIPIDNFETIHTFLDSITLYNNSFNNKGEITNIFVNSPSFLLVLTKTIIIYLLNVLIKDGEPEFNNIMSPIITHLYEYISAISNINNITDENINTMLKQQRAAESNNRLRQFQKKDQESQDRHKLYRKYNLGRQIIEDEDELDIDDAVVDFMTSHEDADMGDDVVEQGGGQQEDQHEDPDIFASGGIAIEMENLDLVDNIMNQDREEMEEEAD